MGGAGCGVYNLLARPAAPRDSKMLATVVHYGPMTRLAYASGGAPMHARSIRRTAPIRPLPGGMEPCRRRSGRAAGRGAALTRHLALALFLSGLASALSAQDAQPEPAVIQWWQGAAVGGGIRAGSALDRAVPRPIEQP